MFLYTSTSTHKESKFEEFEEFKEVSWWVCPSPLPATSDTAFLDPPVPIYINNNINHTPRHTRSATNLDVLNPLATVAEGGLGRDVEHDEHAVGLAEVLLGDAAEPLLT